MAVILLWLSLGVISTQGAPEDQGSCSATGALQNPGEALLQGAALRDKRSALSSHSGSASLDVLASLGSASSDELTSFVSALAEKLGGHNDTLTEDMAPIRSAIVNQFCMPCSGALQNPEQALSQAAALMDKLSEQSSHSGMSLISASSDELRSLVSALAEKVAGHNDTLTDDMAPIRSVIVKQFCMPCSAPSSAPTPAPTPVPTPAPTPEAVVIEVTESGVGCPEGFGPLSEEQCQAGVTVNGTTYEFQSCDVGWPNAGCFRHVPSGKLFYSTCTDRSGVSIGSNMLGLCIQEQAQVDIDGEGEQLEAVIVEVTENGVGCPEGFGPLSKEQCQAGVTVDGTTYEFRPPGHCQNHWPNLGCFRFVPNGNLYYSTCTGRGGVSTPPHFLGLCIEAQGGR